MAISRRRIAQENLDVGIDLIFTSTKYSIYFRKIATLFGKQEAETNNKENETNY